jgi:cell division septation protein DedD
MQSKTKAMTRIEELKKDIKEIEQGLDSTLVPDQLKPDMRNTVEKLKKEVQELEAKEAKKEAASKPNEGASTQKAEAPAAKKTAPKKSASKKTSTPAKPSYSWKESTPVSELQPIVLHCQHYHVTVKEPTEVSLKGTGNASRKVTAKPGEHIIFDDKGHPVFVMNAANFARKCNEQSTVEQHKEEKHKAASEPKASTPKPASKPKPKPKTSKSDDKKPAAAKPVSTSKPAAKKKAENKPASSRRSPVEVIEQEIKDIRKTQKKDMSATEREQFKKEYADLEEKASNKSYIGYIRSQLKAAEKDGVKLSEAQVRKLGQMIQPLIQNPSGAFIDMLYSNKKRLKPTYENLLRWTESPDRYDLIGVDTARTDETLTARKPEKPSIFTLLGI